MGTGPRLAPSEEAASATVDRARTERRVTNKMIRVLRETTTRLAPTRKLAV
jgi:hypothetical protein